MLDTIRVDADRTDFHFTPIVGRTIRGHLGHESTLEGLSVLAHSLPGAMTGASPVEPEGTFELSLPPGPYAFLAVQDDTYWFLAQRTITPAEPVTLQMPTGARVTGRVLDPVGFPAANALVFLCDHPLTLASPSPVPYSEGLAAATLTRDDGRFELTVSPGSYTLVALPANGRGLGSVQQVTLGGMRTINLSLPKSGPATNCTATSC